MKIYYQIYCLQSSAINERIEVKIFTRIRIFVLVLVTTTASRCYEASLSCLNKVASALLENCCQALGLEYRFERSQSPRQNLILQS